MNNTKITISLSTIQRINIIQEHIDFIAVNKPSGMLSIQDRAGEGSLKDILKNRYGLIYTVHRLDKETSGLILFARNEGAHQKLCALFESRNITKTYTGIVYGTLMEKEGIVDQPIMENPSKKGVMMIHAKGKPSITKYTVIEETGPFSILSFNILTGRTHQIRVHMQHLGHPIACDSLYGNNQPIYVSAFKRKFKLSKKEETEKPILNRLALHASSLSFKWNNEDIYIEAPLYKDMKALIQQLKKMYILSKKEE